MLQLRATRFLLIYYLAKAAESSPAEESQVNTSFNGLLDDYNFGHLGYVHLDSDEKIPELEISSCNLYDVNKTTCDFFRRSTPLLDGDAMVLRAWTATTLRDNMLVLFGYLMYQRTSRAFAREIRSSVRLLYAEIRRNGVHTMDIVPRLGELMSANQIGQVIWLLRSLDAVGPAYCQSAVNELGQYFTKRRELLRSILNAVGGVNLLTDIGVQIIPYLRLGDEWRQPFDQDVADALGKEFAMFFGSIQDGRILLTQPVLAVLMLNMRFDGMSPIEMEKFRLLCDILHLNKVPNWSPDTTGACCKNYKDPYDLVSAMVQLMARSTKSDSVVEKTIVDLVPRLVKMPKANPATLQMDQFFGNSVFNISLFLDTLGDHAKIPQVKTFQRLVRNKKIDLSYALKGFIRYFYNNPRLLIIALMERVRYRVPMGQTVALLIDNILAYFRSLDAVQYGLTDYWP